MKDSTGIQRALEDLLERYHAAGYYPSAAAVIFTGKETLAAAHVGDAEMGSLFDVASLTKIATATQILQLIDEDLLELDQELLSCFDELSSDIWFSKRFSGITIRHLLTHTSTLPAWYPFYIWRGQDFWTALKSALINQLPASGVVYSDINFILLGKLIERIRTMPLKDCLERFIVSPMGIHGEMMYQPDQDDARIIPSCCDNAIEERMCAERGLQFDGWRPKQTPVKGTVNDGNCHYYFGDVSGHAGIFSTVGAYQKLCQTYMASDQPLFIGAQQEQAISPGRGLGFETGPVYPHGCGHNGFTGTSIYISREHDIGAVAFTNRLYYPSPSGKNVGEFRRALHELAYSSRYMM